MSGVSNMQSHRLGTRHEGEMFAFLEQVEQSRNAARLRFDVISSHDVRALAAADSGARDALLAELEPSILTVDVRDEVRGGLLQRLGSRPLRESTWYRLKVGPKGEGVPALQYRTIDATEPSESGLEEGSAIDGRSALGRQLRALFNLHDFPSSTDTSLVELLKPVADVDCISVVAFNVGQGNANAICDALTNPLIYFDLGGGFAWNAHTYTNRRQFHWVNSPSVILSHWDLDHYFSATYDTGAWAAQWLVPDQPTIGPTAKRLLAQIRRRGGTVNVWRDPPWLFQLGPMTLSRPFPDSRSTNQRGIVVRVNTACDMCTSGCHVLFPGDVGYTRLEPGFTRDLRGLIASHHGASRHVGAPPSTENGCVIFSYGMNNSYAHPTKSAVNAHRAAGWNQLYDTPHGDVVLIPCELSRAMFLLAGSIDIERRFQLHTFFDERCQGTAGFETEGKPHAPA